MSLSKKQKKKLRQYLAGDKEAIDVNEYERQGILQEDGSVNPGLFEYIYKESKFTWLPKHTEAINDLKNATPEIKRVLAEKGYIFLNGDKYQRTTKVTPAEKKEYLKTQRVTVDSLTSKEKVEEYLENKKENYSSLYRFIKRLQRKCAEFGLDLEDYVQNPNKS